MQKRIDIRAGRRISIQQLIRGTHTHEHEMPEVDMPLTPVVLSEEPAAITAAPNATHVLVRKDVSLVDGAPVEAEIFRGTESQMRNKRQKMMALDAQVVAEGGTPSTYSVRKLK
jgi:hypothetical protein